MLTIEELHAETEGKPILKGLNLTVKPGEIHAIMGPNGAGKSTLAKVLAGHPEYAATSGSITFDGEDLLELEPDERAHAGMFMSFQYPIEVPGVSNIQFLHTAVNAKRKAHKEKELSLEEFEKEFDRYLEMMEIKAEFKHRSLNEGFSGGEKKRNEILQMALLNPKFAILDETDSGLDIDAMKVVAKGVNTLMNAQRGLLLITHYQRLLNYIKPNVVHVMVEGKIVKTGGPELAQELEEKGYDWI
ncbi:MAG: Fe-S cluster assembly ATPase SufC [Chlamydiia bacterium]|nr:Fe-S cluster assembly ATPase SufC [Chlamydiia bacterium]